MSIEKRGGLRMLINDLRSILNGLYYKYGTIDEVVSLSRVIDQMLNEDVEEIIRDRKMRELEECYKKIEENGGNIYEI